MASLGLENLSIVGSQPSTHISGNGVNRPLADRLVGLAILLTGVGNLATSSEFTRSALDTLGC